MRRQEFVITDREKVLLYKALQGPLTPSSPENNDAMMKMYRAGWLEHDYEKLHTRFTLSELGKTVARQLGIGGGA